MREKSKHIIKYEKRTVTCNVGIAKCEDETVMYEKKVKEPPNVIKKLSYVMLELQNVRMKLSNVRKRIREPPNVTKELSHVMLEPHNVQMKLSNVRKN